MADVENNRNSEMDSDVSGLSDEDNKQTESSGLPVPLIVVCALFAILAVGYMMTNGNDNNPTHSEEHKATDDEPNEEEEDNKDEEEDAPAVPKHKDPKWIGGGVPPQPPSPTVLRLSSLRLCGSECVNSSGAAVVTRSLRRTRSNSS